MRWVGVIQITTMGSIQQLSVYGWVGAGWGWDSGQWKWIQLVWVIGEEDHSLQGSLIEFLLVSFP